MRLGRTISVALVGLVAACGYFGSSPRPAVKHPAPRAHVMHAADPATKALLAMVEAVGPSGAQPPVELRFSIRNRPEVGQDDEVDYAVVPQVGGVDSIRLVFGSVGGDLRVVSHVPPLVAIKPASGVPIFGSVTIQPVKAGLFTLTAAVAVESPGQSVVWPFTIPIIVGDGPAQTAANAR